MENRDLEPIKLIIGSALIFLSLLFLVGGYSGYLDHLKEMEQMRLLSSTSCTGTL